MTHYKPRNRNEPTHEAPKATSRWFDDRRDGPANPCGFEPDRWAGYRITKRGKS